MISVDEALTRRNERWSHRTSYTEAETAYLDRAVLSSEVLKLRRELQATVEALAEAELEIQALGEAMNQDLYARREQPDESDQDSAEPR